MKRKKLTEKGFKRWSLTFTKFTILLITLVWTISSLYDAIMIAVAIFTIGNFSYLDTFMTEMGETFRVIVGVNLISKTVENVFKYNEIGGKSLSTNTDDTEDIL